jgi:hypothetical protein
MKKKEEYRRYLLPGAVFVCLIIGLGIFMVNSGKDVLPRSPDIPLSPVTRQTSDYDPVPGTPIIPVTKSQLQYPPDTPTPPVTRQTSDYDPVLGRMVSQVSESEIYRTTRDLQDFSTRRYPSAGNQQAAEYLTRRLTAIPGLETAYQGSTRKNVIAILRGKDKLSDEVFIVGAHYDSDSSDPLHAPGATDNGCGVAAVLELARVMSTHTYNHTLVFAFWNAEESEVRGSMDYATYAKEHSLDIPLYFNYDSSCSDPDNQNVLDIMYDERSEAAAALMTRDNSVYAINFTLTENVYDCDGDHLSFWREGYPVIMTHSPVHAGEAHTPMDTIDLISPGYARKNTQLGMLVLSRLAEIRE